MTDRILVIEAEPSLSKELTLALTEANFDVAGVSDYREALSKLDEFNPNMVIVDEVLLGRDGMKACWQLRSTLDIPVIVLGEDRSDKVWAKVMEAGADLYIVKPLRYLELVARVKAVLRRYKGSGISLARTTRKRTGVKYPPKNKKL